MGNSTLASINAAQRRAFQPPRSGISLRAAPCRRLLDTRKSTGFFGTLFGLVSS
ncbi:hypothetical protein [Paenibacillus dendritiformis]|uniref:hypothetical protein n=1 Tax=Paenibacillus dendritiformis TaxID=130049 RepID=UPI00387E0466